MRLLQLLVVLALPLFASGAWAAGASAGSAASSTPAKSTSTSFPSSSTAASTASSTSAGSSSQTAATAGSKTSAPPPALGAFGIGGGFPSFQTVAPYLSVQEQFVGFQLKVSETAIGPYIGLELRGYPPVPIPVPLFVGIGGGYYGGDVTYFGTLGAHVPLSLHARLDLEGGVASVPLLAKRSWAPYLSIGVSYAFPFTPTYGGYGPEAAAPKSVVPLANQAPACKTIGKPDASRLPQAVRVTIKRWIDSARATYGSIYKDLRYSYHITSRRISGKYGTVKIHYHGSVKSIATGRTESASGNASATYLWTGCAWLTIRVKY